MVKVTLIDQENDVSYEVEVGPEDAERLNTDLAFATTFFNEVKLRHANSNPSKNRYALSDSEEDSVLANTPPAANQSAVPPEDEETVESQSANDEADEGTLYRWTRPCILLLLGQYESKKARFENGKTSQKKCWEVVADELMKAGHNVTGPQCSSKFSSLKKTYKRIKDHNSKSGNDKRTWEYFENMDTLFAKNAWCEPAGLASSTGLKTTKSVTPAENTSGSGKSDSGLSSKTNASPYPPIHQLLSKRLEQKNEHEKARERRHQERMKMDQEVLQLLKKIAEK